MPSRLKDAQGKSQTQQEEVPDSINMRSILLTMPQYCATTALNAAG